MSERLQSRSLLLIVLMAAVGCGGGETTDFVVIDGRRVAFEVAGYRSATVVFESGFGNDRGVWSSVLGDVSTFARAFRYDRPGYGASDSTTTPRTASQIVSELRATLSAAGLEPPYILVGHSLGGMYMEYYAKTFPEEVSALVLVDSKPADVYGRCVAEFNADRCGPSDDQVDGLPAHMQAEWRAIPQAEMELMAALPLRPMPFFVLSAELPEDPTGSDVHELWLQAQADLAAQLPTSVHIVVPGSRHYIQLDAPQAVIDAIRSAVDAASD